MTLSTENHRPHEDFAVRTRHRPGEPLILLARGRLTAAAGEQLCGAITSACGQAGDGGLVVDLTGLTGVEPAGWAWLLPAMQECRAAGCELRIEPPAGELRIEPPSAEDSLPPSAEDPLPPSAEDSLPPSDGVDAPPSSRADPATLRCYPDGPILVRGNFELLGRDCERLPRNRSVLALCRCGGSAIKPFCDGTHKTTRFSDG